jgi:hypothetical protein
MMCNECTPDVVCSYLDVAVYFFENLGGQPPVFSTTLVTATSMTYRPTIADANLDGRADVVVSSATMSDVLCFEYQSGSSGPTFVQHLIPVGPTYFVYYVTVADIDRNGQVDVLRGSATHGNVMYMDAEWSAPSTGAVAGLPSYGLCGQLVDLGKSAAFCRTLKKSVLKPGGPEQAGSCGVVNGDFGVVLLLCTFVSSTPCSHYDESQMRTKTLTYL